MDYAYHNRFGAQPGLDLQLKVVDLGFARDSVVLGHDSVLTPQAATCTESCTME
jgi:hypothetical protein